MSITNILCCGAPSQGCQAAVTVRSRCHRDSARIEQTVRVLARFDAGCALWLLTRTCRALTPKNRCAQQN